MTDTVITVTSHDAPGNVKTLALAAFGDCGYLAGDPNTLYMRTNATAPPGEIVVVILGSGVASSLPEATEMTVASAVAIDATR